jgi:hypothetical protein
MSSKMPTESNSNHQSQNVKGTFGRDASTKLFSIDRTFSSSSTDFRQSSEGIFDEDDELEETVKLNHSMQCNCPPESSAAGFAGSNHQSHCHNNSSSSKSQSQYRQPRKETYHHHHNRDENEECFDFEDAEISVGLPSDLPSGMVDIEGNIIGNANDVRFGQDDDDDDEDDSFCDENPPHRHTKIKNKLSTTNIIDNEHSSTNSGAVDLLPSSSREPYDSSRSYNNNNVPSSLSDNCIEDGPSDSHSSIIMGSSAGTNPSRKKSILSNRNRSRFTRSGGGVSMNSFKGSAGGSSIISDGKMGSMNGSFNSQFYNNFYTRAARRNDFQRYTRGPYAPLDRCNSTSASSANSSTIFQHYYPEGGWGFVVLATAMFSHALLCGFLLSAGVFSIKTMDKFGHELRVETGM